MSGLLEKSVPKRLKMIYSRATGLSLDDKIATTLEFTQILKWITLHRDLLPYTTKKNKKAKSYLYKSSLVRPPEIAYFPYL